MKPKVLKILTEDQGYLFWPFLEKKKKSQKSDKTHVKIPF